MRIYVSEVLLQQLKCSMEIGYLKNNNNSLQLLLYVSQINRLIIDQTNSALIYIGHSIILLSISRYKV